jgi:hypothetical protein
LVPKDLPAQPAFKVPQVHLVQQVLPGLQDLMDYKVPQVLQDQLVQMVLQGQLGQLVQMVLLVLKVPLEVLVPLAFLYH